MADNYSDSEIQRIVRTLIDAAEPNMLWGGTDEAAFKRVANLIKNYRGDKNDLVTRIDAGIKQHSDYATDGLRGMIQAEFSGEDEDEMANAFGYAGKTSSQTTKMKYFLMTSINQILML